MASERDIVERLERLDAMLKEHAWTDDPCILEARDLLARLPVDATGRRHFVGDIVYWPDYSGGVDTMRIVDRLLARPVYRSGNSVEVDKCYPTPEAARAAKEAT